MLSCSMAKDRFNKDLKKIRLNISWGILSLVPSQWSQFRPSNASDNFFFDRCSSYFSASSLLPISYSALCVSLPKEEFSLVFYLIIKRPNFKAPTKSQMVPRPRATRCWWRGDGPEPEIEPRRPRWEPLKKTRKRSRFVALRRYVIFGLQQLESSIKRIYN